jgi:hypothetical protein
LRNLSAAYRGTAHPSRACKITGTRLRSTPEIPPFRVFAWNFASGDGVEGCDIEWGPSLSTGCVGQKSPTRRNRRRSVPGVPQRRRGTPRIRGELRRVVCNREIVIIRRGYGHSVFVHRAKVTGMLSPAWVGHQ